MIGVLLYLFWIGAVATAHPLQKENDYQALTNLPEPDGNLHLYTLPIGLGESHIIQCPSGQLTIYDFGSGDIYYPSYRFMTADDIREFIGDQIDRIGNIVLTHSHLDHYNLFPEVFTTDFPLDGLLNITISCTDDGLPLIIKGWLDELNIRDRIETINSGTACGPNGIPCRTIELCPDDDDVITWIVGANQGDCVADDGTAVNSDSVMLKIERGEASILMTADLDDDTTDWDEDGIQKSLVDYYGSRLQSTVQTLPHHGGNDNCNKPVFQQGIAAKAIIMSGNAEDPLQFYMPNCGTVQRYLYDESSICKPGSSETDDFFCGSNHINVNDTSSLPGNRVQTNFQCGNDELCPDDTNNICQFNDNDFALYSTTPDSDSMNLIQTTITAEGNWGIQAHISITNSSQLTDLHHHAHTKVELLD